MGKKRHNQTPREVSWQDYLETYVQHRRDPDSWKSRGKRIRRLARQDRLSADAHPVRDLPDDQGGRSSSGRT